MKKITLKTEAINKVIDFIAKDGIRYYLSGFLVKITSDNILIVATDSKSLYEAEYENTEKQSECQFILKPSFDKALKTPVEFLELEQISENRFIDNLGNTYEIIDAEYPNYKIVIPETEKQADWFCFFNMTQYKLIMKHNLTAEDAKSEGTDHPVKWIKKYYNDMTETFVFMPIRKQFSVGK